MNILYVPAEEAAFYLLLVVLSVILGIKIAKKNNQSNVLGVIGFISSLLVIALRIFNPQYLMPMIILSLYLFGVIVALVWLAVKGKKQCPFCRGKIPIEARKCKHCGEWLEKSE